MRRRIIETRSQQVAEPGQHPARCRHILAHEDRYRVESVEEKMRMELHAQRVETSLGQPGFQLRSAQLTFTIFAVVIDPMTEADHHPISEHLSMKAPNELRAECLPQRLPSVRKDECKCDRGIDSKQNK